MFEWRRYVPAAKRRGKALRHAAKLRMGGQSLAPVVTQGRTITSTFWGKAWCENLERYSDYANRLPRGRTYVRNGSVIDLHIGAGHISAQVMGSDLYRIQVNVTALPPARWRALGKDCTGSIDSVVELLQGRFSQYVMQRICRPATGLFPSPREIKFACSCPDWAAMCKHVAAVLYGVGARLDTEPQLLFVLRKVDAADLVARAGDGLSLPSKRPATVRVLEDLKLSEIFGIEMGDAEAQTEVDISPPRRARGTPQRETAPKPTPRARAGKVGQKRARVGPERTDA
jgi:uncharacterized Zn finger protein